MTDEEYNKKLKQDAIDIMSEIMELDNGGVFDQEHVLEVLRENLPFVYKNGYNKAKKYAKTIIKDLLSNSDEYARQRAMDFLNEN